MPSLTIKGFPPALLKRLRLRAKAENRSLTKEVIHLLQAAIANEPASDEARLREQISTQIRIWRRLAGQWDSDMTAAEESKSILDARIRGRRMNS